MRWDFFVSVSAVDEDWAVWMEFHLTRAGHEVLVERCGRAPGHNRVHRLDEAVRQSRRTLVVLSPAYLADEDLAAEWHAAWEADPAGLRRTLIPVRVADCRPQGLLGDLRCVDLVGLDRDKAAATLIAQITGRRREGPLHRLYPR